MKPANDVARAFLLSGGKVHLCASATCDCERELAALIERAREEGANSYRFREHRARLAKPRIAEALEEIRSKRRA